MTIEDRQPSGAHFEYVFESDHNHWHFMGTARYELVLPGGGSRPSDKVGFCMLDSFDTVGLVKYFPPGEHWCNPSEPDSDFTRMGLSPGACWPGGRTVSFEPASAPQHGSVSFAQAGDLASDATYTPAAGFVGTDSFTYTATDARGLESAPATVAVTVGEPAAGPPPAARLVRGAVVRRRGGRWFAVLRLGRAGTVGARLERNGRAVWRLGRRALAAGRHRIVLGRLRRPGRYTLVLRVRAGARSRAVRLRFRVRR